MGASSGKCQGWVGRAAAPRASRVSLGAGLRQPAGVEDSFPRGPGMQGRRPGSCSEGLCGPGRRGASPMLLVWLPLLSTCCVPDLGPEPLGLSSVRVSPTPRRPVPFHRGAAAGVRACPVSLCSQPPSRDWESLGHGDGAQGLRGACLPGAPWWGRRSGAEEGALQKGVAGQPLSRPHPVTPADAPSAHWTLSTSVREPSVETKAGRWGQILMDTVSGESQAAARGPQRGWGRGRERPGLHLPPLPGRRPSPGEVCWAIVRGTQDVSYTRWPCAV